jgi:hypothetical protein
MEMRRTTGLNGPEKAEIPLFHILPDVGVDKWPSKARGFMIFPG